MSSDEIDALIELYLNLLDTYTILRSSLTELQSSVQHSLSRANFLAERGLRYGQDHYDSRLQATQLVTITPSEPPSFKIYNTLSATRKGSTSTDQSVSVKNDPNEKVDDKNANPGSSETVPTPKNPLYMFGLLTPQPLRDAQSSSLKLVGEIVPDLVSVDVELRAVEIEIRRARKKILKKGRVEKDVVTESVNGMRGKAEETEEVVSVS